MRLGVEAALVDGRLVPGDVAVADGRVEAVGLSGRGRGIAAPGFVDLQVNGFAGVDFLGADRDGYARAGAALLATGTTAFQPTFITAPEDVLVAALRGLPAAGIGPRVIGAHVEGPFISPRRLGVHPAAARRDPDPALLERLLAAGPVTHMTLAPELPGALALIDRLRAAGVTVATGHTAATAAAADAAFDRGVRTVTHLYNAMSPEHAAAALARADVVVQVIVDLHHVPADTVRAAWRPGRFALVSDAVAAAGAGDGAFRLGAQTLHARGGVVRGADGRLAGSALTMLDAVRNLHGLGVALADALTAATAVPARVAGRGDLGRLAPGTRADIVVLSDRLEVERTLLSP